VENYENLVNVTDISIKLREIKYKIKNKTQDNRE
jgi:hypothetical protein